MEKQKQFFDTKYIVQFKKGDQTAFDVIFKYYKNHVYWTGINFFSNEEKAKDLVQSVFLEIYQNIDKLKEPAKFYPWMNRIAYSRCMQMLRYEMKDSLYYVNSTKEAITDYIIEDNKIVDPITYIQKEHMKEIIIEEIEKLSPKHRTICYLRFFEELSYAEINEITQVPVGTISNYIGRLKPKLQKALQKHGFVNASCLSLIMLPNISVYFKAFVNSKEALTDAESKVILQEVKCSKKIIHKQMKKPWQIVAYGCMGVAAFLLPLGVAIIPRENNAIMNMMSGNNAVIEKITHLEQVSNSPFKIQVKVSSENYDEVLLNDKTDLTVEYNGEYTIKLMRNGKEIDTKIITITNIDRDIPIITNQLLTNGIMTLNVEDTNNQIDFEHIEFYEDGTITNNFKFNEEKREVYIPKEVAPNNLLKVPDIAGNILEVRIFFYEINAT